MRGATERILQVCIVVVLVHLIGGTAAAQFELALPLNGAAASSRVTLECSPGENDFFAFYSIFPYEGLGYYPVTLPWSPMPSLTLPRDWWDAIAMDLPCYWGVIGFDAETESLEGLPPWGFLKVAPELDMAEIIPTCFNMGDAYGDGQPDELPVHGALLSRYEIDLYEVTNGRYAECVGAGGCSPPWDATHDAGPTAYGDPAFSDHPVVYVSWVQATEYCAWAGKRLPTEAEWEYAARGGLTGKRYPWGDTITGANANFIDSGDPWDNDNSPVGYYPPNGYGLYDVAGNVWEWVGDWYQSDYYSFSPPVDPLGPESGRLRVVRGGSCIEEAHTLRVSNRSYGSPQHHYRRVGFRCAQSGSAERESLDDAGREGVACGMRPAP